METDIQCIIKTQMRVVWVNTNKKDVNVVIQNVKTQNASIREKLEQVMEQKKTQQEK